MILATVLFTGLNAMILDTLSIGIGSLIWLIISLVLTTMYNLLHYVLFLFLFGVSVSKVCGFCEEVENQLDCILANETSSKNGNIELYEILEYINLGYCSFQNWK